MSIIILVIALTFSARKGASSVGAERNGAAQSAAMYSANDRGSAEQAERATAAASNDVRTEIME